MFKLKAQMRVVFFLMGFVFVGCKKGAEITIPLSPTELKAQVNSGSQVSLTWVDKSTNEAGFRLERKVSGGGFAVISTLGADKTSHLDEGLTPGTTYTYRVSSYNSAGPSLTYSNEVTVTTSSPTLQWTRINNTECFNIVKGKNANDYFLVIRNGVLKSIDEGKTWSATNWTVTSSAPALSSSFPGAAYSSFLGGQLMVAANDKGFYLSNDNGTNYASTGLEGFGVNSFAMTALDNGRFIGGLWGNSRGIYKTSGNDNKIWSSKWAGRDPQDFTKRDDNILFSVYSENNDAGGGLLKTTDGGESWTKVHQANTGLYDCEVINDSISWFDRRGNMFITSINNPNYGVLARSQFPTLASLPTANYSSFAVVKAVYYGAKDLLIVAAVSGVYVSANHGLSWVSYTLPGVVRYENILAVNGNIFICTSNGLFAAKI